MKILFLIVPLLAIILTMTPVLPLLSSGPKKSYVKSRFAIHFSLFFLVLILTTIFFFTNGLTAFAMSNAQAAKAAGTVANGMMSEGLKYIGAALAIGLACIGAGLAVGGAAPAAIGAYSEDKDTFGKAMIFVVLGEGIAIYGFVISFLVLFSK